MLTITIPGGEVFNEKLGTFVKVTPCTLKLEHSLLSLQKWESKHHKYFIDNKTLTASETIDYVRCMTLNQVDDNVYDYLTDENVDQILKYIEDPMTATWFSKADEERIKKRSFQREIVTGEVIYSSMIALNIPVELFEKRHLNHLLTLIKVCNETQNPDEDKNMTTNDIAKYYSRLNKERKAKLGTKG